LDYVGVSFGLTLPLLKFWKRLGFVAAYLRQNANDLTGEHTCIVLSTVSATANDSEAPAVSAGASVVPTANSDGTWLPAFFCEFRRRFINLLGICFVDFSPYLAMSLMFMGRDSAMANWIPNKRAAFIHSSYQNIPLSFFQH
jgi:N-acetyltransferase 10